jgi:hypothetical protein
LLTSCDEKGGGCGGHDLEGIERWGDTELEIDGYERRGRG